MKYISVGKEVLVKHLGLDILVKAYQDTKIIIKFAFI